ncbi:hypothetical protein CG736_35110 [Kitasatospora sp. CB02891]|nr:hypothetical protein CG736_35110 [Kitasatospora sp. CB02891]
MRIDLTGRTAPVTGSTVGIGAAAARALADAGADVVVNGRSPDRVAEAAERIGGRGVAADAGTAAGTAELIRQLPGADILVNSTGIFATVPVFDITDEDRPRSYEVNLLFGVRLARHRAPRTVARGRGRVVFVSSEAGVRTLPDMVRYGTTRTAQPAVFRGTAQEVAGSGVTVNRVLPGPTTSDGVPAMSAEPYPGVDPAEQDQRHRAESRGAASLLRRLIRPREAAGMITYVASEQASATTGRALGVDGGLLPTILPRPAAPVGRYSRRLPWTPPSSRSSTCSPASTPTASTPCTPPSPADSHFGTQAHGPDTHVPGPAPCGRRGRGSRGARPVRRRRERGAGGVGRDLRHRLGPDRADAEALPAGPTPSRTSPPVHGRPARAERRPPGDVASQDAGQGGAATDAAQPPVRNPAVRSDPSGPAAPRPAPSECRRLPRR